MNILPQEVYLGLKLVTEIFNEYQIKYWLGGGLFQLISQNKFQDIEANYKNHDIDLHIQNSQKMIAYKALNSCPKIQELGIYPSANKEIKTAFKIGDLSFETPFLFESPDDANVFFYVSWGKKENWPLSQEERQRFYYFSFPREIFSEETINIDNLKIRVPRVEYVRLLYK